MKKIHDTIFTILVTHRYLIEAHPKRAGGGESIRTTYAVGPYYDRVLEDYYTIQRERGITVEPVAQEPSEIPLPIPYDDLAVERTERTEDTTIEPPLSPLNSQKLKDAINQHLGSGLFYRNFLMSSHIRHERYKDALEIAKISFPRFIHSVYINYYEESKEISRNELLAFLNQLSLVEGFPISYLELSSFVDTCDTISMEDSNLEQLINKVYIQYDSMFYSFKQFVEG